ncbi:ATP-binding protein [Streptomyces sp. NPDC051684]|uniref:ATP-binding protein n=1 Tax=Streptomyces sp. NPDC051684 TaxID=3365670 RepID=UPI003790EB7B
MTEGQLKGRERELAALLTRLASWRLVSLVGPSGVGRTRLAQEAVEHVRARGRREVVWESGAGLDACVLAGVAVRLRHRLGVRPGRLLRARPLLVLDDWEHLGGAGTDLLAELLEDVPGLTVLRISDRPSWLRGEAVHRLPPLSPSAAVGLLADAAGGRLLSDPGTAARGTALAHRLDGLPGALLDAGRRLRGPADLAAVERHPYTSRALADAERAYARSPRGERQLLRRLAVFEGDFDLRAVREVCATGALPAARIPVLMERVAPFALVPGGQGGEGHPGGRPRSRLTGPMREVCLRALEAAGERWALALHHRTWCARLARRAAECWSRGRQREARALVLRQLPDLQRAMDPGTGPRSPTAEAGAALDTVLHLWFLWVACGRAREGRVALRRVLSLHQGPVPARAWWLTGLLELLCADDEAAEAALLNGRLAAERDGDDRCLGLLAHARGVAALRQGRLVEAVDALRWAAELLGEAPGFGPGAAGSRAALALALVRTDPEAAQELVLPRSGAAEVHDPWAEAWLGHAQAELLRWEGGPLEVAAEEAGRALHSHLAHDDTESAACTAELAADIAAARGRTTLAAQLLRSADELRGAGPHAAAYCAPVRRRVEAALRAPAGPRRSLPARAAAAVARKRAGPVRGPGARTAGQ